ncbi:MAG TPA: HEAT repeat domain-containing protein [Candidatus Acidoferrales bacterium]|nr:HEAT repeat domain-containing protein [Candidatus Acidoferrales bacterium]
MADFLHQLLALIEKGTVEHRCAALLVLGALKAENGAVIKTVTSALDHPNPIIKDYALRYFEEADSKSHVEVLLKFLEDPDRDIQERVIRMLTEAGQAVVPSLLRVTPGASRPWLLNASRVLCAVRGKAALKGLLQMLRAGTDEFNKAVCDLMIPAIRQMDIKEQGQFGDEVEAFATTLDVKQQRPALVSAMRLLAQLGRPQARRWLFKFVGPEHPPILRSHALIALLRGLREQDLHKDEYAKLFPLLEESEFSEVTRVAIELLDSHELPDDARSLLSRLMQSPHSEVQKFALRKMGSFGTPATVRTLLEQLGDPDYRRRDVAANSLRKIPEARTALIKELVACQDASKAWSIAELLPAFEGKWRQDVLESLWKRLQKAIESEDRIQTAFLNVFKQADQDYAYEQLAANSARLLKAKKYKEAVAFLTPLKEFPSFKPENKFQLALAQVKLHSHTITSHRQHPAVELLADLYRNSAYPLFEALKRERSLTVEEIFALGFSLVERPGDERNVGKELLEHIASKFPRNKIGKNAKNKLKLVAA